MPTSSITSWGDAVRTSIAGALTTLLDAIPKILGFAVLLIVGWLVASLVAKAVLLLLHKLRFNQLAERAGISRFMEDMGVQQDASEGMASLVKWFIRLIFLVSAFDALGLPVVSALIQRLLLWLPNLFVALIVLVIGGLAANAVGKLVRGVVADAGLGNAELMEKVAKVLIWAFAFLIAVNQIGVASSIINTLVLGFVAALALGLGLAFGLGGRDTAGEIIRSWYRRGQQASSGGAPSAEQAQQRIDEAAAAANGGSQSPAASSAASRRP